VGGTRRGRLSMMWRRRWRGGCLDVVGRRVFVGDGVGGVGDGGVWMLM
jgi:hypothetical protein